jgi:hypothetical protein
MSVREADDPQLFARIQEQNLLRQYDLLANCIEIGLKKGIETFDKYTLWSLNAAAIANIAQFGGRFRERSVDSSFRFSGVMSAVAQLCRRAKVVETAKVPLQPRRIMRLLP